MKHGNRWISKRYEIDPKTGCWNWLLGKHQGYGRERDTKTGKLVLAYRRMYEEVKGPVPDGMELDHLCRNRACVNPDHLDVVDDATNSRRGKVAKLTMDKALEARRLVAEGMSCASVAKKFGVDASTIQRIKNNKTWR